MKEYIALWKNYFNFGARTTCRGYWMAMLVNIVISFLFGLIIGMVPAMAPLVGVYSLAIFIPGLAITVRRLRDAGKEWYWIFITLIPFVGAIWFIVILASGTKSTLDVEIV